ncbi:peptidylprolyl isomerase [Silanimonas algicola]
MLAVLLLAALPALATVAPPAAPTPPGASVPAERVALETSAGRIVLELDPGKAPRTVANFLAYVESGHYNGTVFHRVVPNLLVQGGAFTPDLQPKPERAPVPLEADNGLSNLRGTIAAARRPDTRDSATSQFFINVVDNPQFDAVDPANDIGAGYAVFGRVVEGMDVVDAMRNVDTGAQGPFPSRVPKQAIVIERAVRLAGTAR